MGDAKRLEAAKRLFGMIGQKLGAEISVRLWDGSVVPLGPNADPNIGLSIRGPGVIGALLRRPSLETVIRQYATGGVDFYGADFIDFADKARVKNSRRRVGKVSKLAVARNLLPFLFARDEPVQDKNGFNGDDAGFDREQSANKDYIQFHYDIGNDFYKLFLDRNMVYTCGYFTDWNNSLEQAQLDKLDMICRKLQLKPGERMLDIGCGWGALICHAAEHYGVYAHGVTLAEEQVEYTQQLIRERGLEGRASIELKDYNDVEGSFDKVSSIGMVEHVGIANMPLYLNKINSLLPDRGIFLNHGITRPAKKSARKFRKLRPEQKALRKYIFPGGELDHIGHSLELMESHGFRVSDVEGWRDHYAQTCRHWCRNLYRNRDEAIRLVGAEKYRLWLAYLGGVSYSLGDGSACIFQTVATKHASKGVSGMPPTRQHLYEPRPAGARAAA
ncbi:SAM-dependent methyltransferase [Botrimarina mediterranea]|uniref:Cyclopropane mycolic acid synthase 3 n=1 Tax=Botrimarina mediterranea TaxID=2528022 RepID=A0A518KBZ4_9BACT|nr:cyclopropane-fatty-acyl-phospholipid synthase family protein [Botrimarina mediterranea]QDV75323.1 Cyclopropane mycolic acid synthase 3 [Botrimarina mediterranea]